MRYVAAYLLANLGGNDSPSANDIKKILESVGVNVDDEKLNKVVSQLNGKDVNEVIAAGKEKLAGIPTGGVVSGGGGGGGGAAAAGGGEEAAKEEEKKEEKKEESEESDDDMGFGLFD